MSKSLSTKYRPKDFESVCGQNSIVKILQRQIQLKDYKHAYLFTGSTGIGKTTLCRILASKINGDLSGIEEIDGASNNGVDNIRNIIKAAQERSVSSKYKIFIIDECHALTNQSWQALLKCIEEPPQYTIFMFCTTDAQKIPATIINRCQRYNLSKISDEKIYNRLKYICEQEHFTNYEETIRYISKTCNGGLRDAISTLEKVSSYSTEFNIETTLEILGNYSYDILFNLVNNIIDSKQDLVLKTISSIYYNGDDLKVFVDKFLSFCLEVTKYCLFKDIKRLEIPDSFEQALNSSINFNTPEKYYMILVDKLLELKNLIKSDNNIKTTVEAYFLRMCRWE